MKAWIAAIALFAAAPLAAQPQDITAPGTVPHRAAGTGFPESIGDFRRLGVVRYDAEGRDISANYQLVRDDGEIRASIYIYPGEPDGSAARRERACADHFEGVEAAIRQAYPGAARVEGGEAPARAGVPAGLAHRSVFRIEADIGRGPEALASESRLYCFVAGSWLVKYRISAPASMDARAAIESFVRRGPWPGEAAGEIALR
ncbi:MAG TPA: hypothetical protein VLK25_10105 [Allosphingosinicella sp.]|nr:hypothetical protein [Allosphingosinicella sp.]